MLNRIAPSPTRYRGINFRSRLEATWAAFFDIFVEWGAVEFEWEYEPTEFGKWVPDFYFKYHCGHSECYGYHDLYAEVKPYRTIEEFKDHYIYPYVWNDWGQSFKAHGVALLGQNATIAKWCISHGSGGGEEDFMRWGYESAILECWKTARNKTQWIYAK